MGGVIIRLYQQSDAEAIAAMINQDPLNFQYGLTAQEFDRELDEPGERIRENTFVLLVHAQIIGYLSLCFSDSGDRIHVYCYAGVDQDWRRKGIGTRILQFIVQHLTNIAVSEERTIVFVHRADSRAAGLTELALQQDMIPGHELRILRNAQLDRIAADPLPGYVLSSPKHSDAASWAAIYNDAFGGHKTADQVIHEFKRSDYNPDLYILATSIDGMPAAFVSSKLVGEMGKIPTLAVRPEHQGQGLGQALLAEVLTRLRKAGAIEVTLTVGIDNRKALHLYKKLGFGSYATRCNYYKEIRPSSAK
ncbi:GNAT family N-acetyltransferase [Paenibacillus mendelii]|uniref:GNAT family N-acetyltransferase n=1 Tax=Paenibacillus mendelii TaxID=206163 RepID=A0ABV6J2K2_9BACL